MISIIIVAFNEEAYIKSIIAELKNFAFKLNIAVKNCSSPCNFLFVCHDPDRSSLGGLQPAVRRGFPCGPSYRPCRARLRPEGLCPDSGPTSQPGSGVRILPGGRWP